MKKKISTITIIFLSILILILYKNSKKMKTVNAKIDHVFVINLDKSKERLEAIKRTLSNEKIEFERFSATYGKDAEIENPNGEVFLGKDISEKFKLNEKYKIKCSNDFTVDYNTKALYYHRLGKKLIKESNRKPMPGEIGCTCSHLRAINEIANKKYNYGLILEDDTKPVNEGKLKQNIETVVNTFPINCDLLYLFNDKTHFAQNKTKLEFGKLISFLEYGKPVNDIFYITKYFREVSLTNGYIITQRGAQKIIEEIKKNGMQNMPIDIYLSSYLMNRGIIKGCMIGHKIVTINDFGSEIQDMGGLR